MKGFDFGERERKRLKSLGAKIEFKKGSHSICIE